MGHLLPPTTPHQPPQTALMSPQIRGTTTVSGAAFAVCSHRLESGEVTLLNSLALTTARGARCGPAGSAPGWPGLGKPLPCASTAVAAETPPLPCASTAFMGKCTAFALCSYPPPRPKTAHFPCGPPGKWDSAAHRSPCSKYRLPSNRNGPIRLGFALPPCGPCCKYRLPSNKNGPDRLGPAASPGRRLPRC